MEDEAIFNDISETIKKGLLKTHKANPKPTGIAQSSFEIAIRQLI
jgi:hypothetical protein